MVHRPLRRAHACPGAGLAGDPGGRNTLIAAPTGSGKTLAAFLAAIDGLVRQGLEGALPDTTQVVYVSPLKALSNDIQRNLEEPIAGIRATLAERGLPDVEIRAWVRTGDTPQAERNRTRRRPPHILVTTPESLYILLGSASGRTMLATTRTVIVDEIHAMAPNKRGAHLALSLERLAALCGDKLVRIGLSATQNPIESIAHLLGGTCHERRRHRRHRPPAPARSDAGSARLAAGSGDVGGGLAAGLRPIGAADRGAPHHAGLRQHAPHGRARRAPTVRPPGRDGGHRASRQHGEGTAPVRGAAPEARRTEGAGGHRIAGTRHRYRRRGSGVPARFAALDRQLPATCRPLRPRRRRPAEGPPVPAVARRSGGMRGAARQRPPRRTRSADPSASAARRAGAADRCGSVAHRTGPRTALYDRLRRAWPYRDLCRATISPLSCTCWPRVSPPAAAGAAR